MLITKIVLAMTCGIALTTSALAHEPAADFEYWPVARHLRSGQFQAEIWRHDLRNDYRDLAWSNQEAFATPARAMAAACSSVQHNFDASFACSRVAQQASTSDKAPANQESTVVGKKPAVTAVESKGSSQVREPVYRDSSERHAWLKDFWTTGGK